MKKLLFLLFGVYIFAFEWSGKVNWAMSYDMAKNLAQKEHKLIMVDVALSHCPPCKYLATQVYTDDDVANYINQNFIPLFYLADKDRLPAEVQNYFTGSTPTIMFIKPSGELFYSFIGARPPKAFLRILQDVNAKFRSAK
ncbi:MAG: thioredoxin family protein [Epsilonproteobacteria bacterium]|nr:thioredoxin family protein [Campylobacterota bacterium]